MLASKMLDNVNEAGLKLAQATAGEKEVHDATVALDSTIAGTPTLGRLGVQPDHGAASTSDRLENICTRRTFIVPSVA